MKRSLVLDGEAIGGIDQKNLSTARRNGKQSVLTECLMEGASAWNVSLKTMMLICSIPFIIAGIGALTALLGKSAYKWFTAEDGLAENLQVIFWLLIFVLSFSIIRQQKRVGDHLVAVLYGVLALGVFFLIGEELSWGQRIFGWATPEDLAAINKQHETNIHNIHGIGSAFKWVHVLIGAYGTLLPLLVLRSKALARFGDRIEKLVPHITFLPFFALPLAWRLYVNLFEPPARFVFVVAEYSEVIELILAIGFFLFMLYQLRYVNKIAADRFLAKQRA